jgi:hypothetical protein
VPLCSSTSQPSAEGRGVPTGSSAGVHIIGLFSRTRYNEPAKDAFERETPVRFIDPIRFFFVRPEPHIETREERGVKVMTMWGRFADASDKLIQTEFRSVAASEPADVLINLRDAVLVGNHAVGMLTTNLRRLQWTAKCVKLVRPVRMDWWLSRTRVTELLEMYEDEEEALQSFGGAGE